MLTKDMLQEVLAMNSKEQHPELMRYADEYELKAEQQVMKMHNES